VNVLSHLTNGFSVIKYLNIALHGEPYPFLVLEFVAGGCLEDFVLTPALARPALDTSDVMKGIGRGQAAARPLKIYHRDLKPPNIV
jgi:serine/threonine protein kinase